MQDHAPRRSGHRTARNNKKPAGHRVSAGIRPYLVTACAAVLALVLAAAIHSSAEARPLTARPLATGPAPATATGPVPEPMTAAAPTAAGAKTAPVGPINAALDADVAGIINATSQFQIGVALIDLSDGVLHHYGVPDAFEAASTAKVLAAAAYYHLVETGGASLDEPMGEDTSGFQLREMIQDSDNDSWARIMDAIGYSELQDYAASIGVTYRPDTNTLTPAEMAMMLASLYAGKLLNGQDTAQLLSYMQHTNYEVLIPAALPDGITVYHKYGLLDGELHDASILTNGTSAYAFVVYTNGEDASDIQERAAVIHQLTQAVAGSLF